MDGCTVDMEGEKDRVIKCLEAAIQRRISDVSTITIYVLLYLNCIFSGRKF